MGAIALTTLGDGQGLFGMNVLHFDRCVCRNAWEREEFEVVVNFLRDNFGASIVRDRLTLSLSRVAISETFCTSLLLSTSSCLAFQVAAFT